MRIGVNLEALRPGEIGGLERYVRQLVDSAVSLDSDLTWVLALAPYNADTFAAGPGIEKRVLTPEAFQDLDAATLAQWNLDLWFCPLLTLEPERPGLPSVAMIPDLQHETFPEYFSAEILAWRHQHFARTVRDADRVLTISVFSRQDIVTRFGLEETGTPSGTATLADTGTRGLPRYAEEALASKVVAVPLGPGAHFITPQPWRSAASRQRVRAAYDLPDRFLLYPAHGWPHKNHRALFEAVALLRESRDDCPDLVLTGGGQDAAWAEAWGALGITECVRHLGRIPDTDLPAVYAQATLMVFPSLFEGFGLPVLEAMCCGCPVLSGETTSLPEVGGDAVVRVDATSPQALADTIAGLLDDPARRQTLSRRGRERAVAFDAETVTQKTLGVLRAAAASKKADGENVDHDELSPKCVRAESERAGSEPTGAPIEVREAPPVTVVTPSYQQAAFLARTLDSVLGQGYPKLQYLVMDGGSRDSSVELLETYRARYPDVLSYVSEPDGGQADAVNKGLERATGTVIGWLNSDDVYRPGTLEAVVDAFERSPNHAWLYGRASYIDADDNVLGPYPTREEFGWQDLAHECFLCQPAVFWQRERLDQPYRVDANLQMCMDYDLWIRMGRIHPPLFVERELSASRVHPHTKTLSQRRIGFAETIGTVKRHYGYAPVSWVAGKARYLLQPMDDPLVPGRIKLGTWLLSALLVARHNPTRPSYVWRACSELVREARRLRQEHLAAAG